MCLTMKAERLLRCPRSSHISDVHDSVDFDLYLEAVCYVERQEFASAASALTTLCEVFPGMTCKQIQLSWTLEERQGWAVSLSDNWPTTYRWRHAKIEKHFSGENDGQKQDTAVQGFAVAGRKKFLAWDMQE